jgi:hypothetical protein
LASRMRHLDTQTGTFGRCGTDTFADLTSS